MAEKYFATIISIEQNKRQWAYNGNQFYDHHITVKFDNGNQETGIYSSKNPVCTAFQQGVRTEIERDVKVQGQYTNIKYKPVTAIGANGKGGFKAGSYGKNKAQEIREHLTLLTANSVKVAFDTVAAEGVPQGMSLEDAIVNKTHSIVMKLARISGVDKLIEEAKAEKQSSEQQQQQAQVQQPIANPAANPAAMGGPGSPVNMSTQAPIGNAGGMPSDDLPF